MRLLFATLACLSFAAPAFAGEADALPSRLTPGGFDLNAAEQRSQLVGGRNFSLGATTSAPQPGRLAVGGYAAYGLDEHSEAAVNLGYSGGLPFSPNASQPGADLLVAPSPSLSLSLSLRRDLSPGLSLGGYAAATRAPSTAPLPGDQAGSDYRVGVGAGVKF